MTLAQLEQAAEDAAWARDYTRNGYGYHANRYGAFRIQHRRGDDRKSGQRSYWANSVQVSKAQFVKLIEEV